MSKNLLAIIILALAVLALFIFVLPAYDQLMATRAVRQERRTLLASAQATRDAIVRLDNEYHLHAADIARLDIALPVSKQVDYLSSSIEHAAAASATQLVGVSIGEGVARASYQAIPAKIDVSCGYADCIRFLGALESSLRLYDLNRITMSSSGARLLIMSVTLHSYSIR